MRGAAKSEFQWYRDGKPIPGATGPTYTVKPADMGRTFSFGRKRSWLGNIAYYLRWRAEEIFWRWRDRFY